MIIGNQVKATRDIGGFLQQSVPASTVGRVVGTTYDRRIVVRFVLPGVLGGTREVDVPVERSHIAQT